MQQDTPNRSSLQSKDWYTSPRLRIYPEGGVLVADFTNNLKNAKAMKGPKEPKSGWHLHPLMWLVVTLLLASVAILVVGLLIPPPGEVHPSVLKGLGILTADIALTIFAYAVVSGKTATFTHGNTSATVGGKKSPATQDAEQETT